MYATNYCETQWLSTMNNVTCVAPSNFYIGLYLGNPSETGTSGNEIAYSGYNRQKITFSTPAAVTGGIGMRNDTLLEWAESPIDAGTVTHIGIIDSLSSGNMWLYGELTEPLVIRAGQEPSVSVGEILFYLTGQLSNTYKTKFLNIFRNQNISGFTPYHSLWNGNPEAGGSELSGVSYARMLLTLTSPTEQTGGQMQIENSGASQYPSPTTSWGTWAYSAIMDTANSGTPVWINQRTTTEPILKNYTPKLRQGGLKIAVN